MLSVFSINKQIRYFRNLFLVSASSFVRAKDLSFRGNTSLTRNKKDVFASEWQTKKGLCGHKCDFGNKFLKNQNGATKGNEGFLWGRALLSTMAKIWAPVRGVWDTGRTVCRASDLEHNLKWPKGKRGTRALDALCLGEGIKSKGKQPFDFLFYFKA